MEARASSRSSAYVRSLRSFLLAASVLAAALVGPLSTASMAAESAAVKSPRATVTLISDAQSVAPGQKFRIGLRQQLAPHWHTYWKNPGDAGAPPEIKLDLPAGATAGAIEWPGPDRLPIGPLVSFGYESEIVLPIEVTVPQSAATGQNFTVQAHATWLVCERECIPEEGAFKLDLPIAEQGTPASPSILAAFATGDARKVVPAPWTTRVSDGDRLTLTVDGEGLSTASVQDATFFPAEWGAITNAAPQNLTVGDGHLSLSLEKGEALNKSAPIPGVLRIRDTSGNSRWLDIAPTFGGVAAPTVHDQAPPAELALPFWEALVFAFIGGLILNLMPCVFPVLAIKATSIARMSRGALHEVRWASLFYTLGVLVAFLALAGGLLAARAGGAAVGWGFQFQSPLFVAAMAWLMLAIGLNLSGVYEIGLGMGGTGQGLTSRQDHAGSFFTGLLAVVVATPCTAPFMGAALGTALAAPAGVALGLFLAMGLGLAAPYLALAIVPGAANWLPSPGIWMLRLRQGMAFLMYASAAWLVWVLSIQAGETGVSIVLAGSLLVALAAWLYGIAQHGGGRHLVTRGAATLALLGTFALLPQLSGAAERSQTKTTPDRQAADYEPFSAARLTQLRSEGKPVFVNMTAAWCITCLVNDRTALSTDAVRSAMRAKGIVYLKGDWTNRDPEITAFLRAFGRDGLPFYAFYPGGAGQPVVLPTVLTVGNVLAEFERTTTTLR